MKLVVVLINVGLLSYERFLNSALAVQINRGFIPQQGAAGKLLFFQFCIFFLEFFDEFGDIRFVIGNLLGEYHGRFYNSLKVGSILCYFLAAELFVHSEQGDYLVVSK